MAAGVWARAGGGVSQAALTLDCSYPHPALGSGVCGLHPFPQVPDLKPLSSGRVASLHMGAPCQLLPQVQAVEKLGLLVSELASNTASPKPEPFLSGDPYPVLPPALLVMWGWPELLPTGLLEVLEPGLPRPSEYISSLLPWQLQAEGGNSSGCCPSGREKLVF